MILTTTGTMCKKFETGQAMVEFVLTLPLFLLMLFGFIYVGMFSADYMTLKEIARIELDRAIHERISDGWHATDRYKNRLLYFRDDSIDYQIATSADLKTARISVARKSNTLWLGSFLPETCNVVVSAYNGDSDND